MVSLFPAGNERRKETAVQHNSAIKFCLASVENAHLHKSLNGQSWGADRLQQRPSIRVLNLDRLWMRAHADFAGGDDFAALLDRRAEWADDWSGSGRPESGLVGLGGRGGSAGVAVGRRWDAPEAVFNPAKELASKAIFTIAAFRTSGPCCLCRPPQDRLSFGQLF